MYSSQAADRKILLQTNRIKTWCLTIRVTNRFSSDDDGDNNLMQQNIY